MRYTLNTTRVIQQKERTTVGSLQLHQGAELGDPKPERQAANFVVFLFSLARKLSPVFLLAASSIPSFFICILTVVLNVLRSKVVTH